MKKYLYLPILLLLLVTNYLELQAQITGRSSNSQNPGKEVEAESITSGSLSNDVNLFTGTLNTSYSLGTVKTLSGLSFTATLAYNSVFSSGDNMPHLSGVPYGDGWSLDVPMISISTEDYNKYTMQNLDNMNSGNGAGTPNGTERTPTFVNSGNCDDAKLEGRLYWFAPSVNIPGVGGGRMVYKNKDGNEYVFVPNRFERYMEARLDMTTLKWRVITDDGTEYRFKHVTIQHRNPVNQRTQFDCQTADVLKNTILPKSEITTWYCDEIVHPNHVGSIKFVYETYGRFDYMKVFKSYLSRILSGAESYFNLSGNNILEVPAKDIFIKEISSPSEKLLLNYSHISTTGGVNIPTHVSTDPDMLYSRREVYKTSTNTFNNWRRYNHIRSDEVSLGCTRNNDFPFTSQLNPYITRNSVLPTNNGIYNFKSISGSPSSVAFEHGFLESPKLDLSSFEFIPGDVYEVEFRVKNLGSPTFDALFDVNIATGDNPIITGQTGTLNGNTFMKADCKNKLTGESVFSTFNQAVKWQAGFNSSTVTFSNFFTMPNLPNSHTGINLQIGPANSDTRFSFGDQVGTSPTFLTDLATNNCPTFLNKTSSTSEQTDDASTNPTALIRSGGSIPNNFGIGYPWFMLQRQTGASNRAFYGNFQNCGSLDNKHWWNDKRNKAGVQLPSCTSSVQWANLPTRATTSTLLESASLIRYAKKTLMLTSVEYQVKNSAQTFVTVQRLNFDYSIQQINTFAPAFVPNSNQNITYNTGRNRNVVLLSGVQQVAFDNSTLATSKKPKTKFSYTSQTPFTTTASGQTAATGIFPLNGNFFLLTEVVNALGGKTQIEYYPLAAQTDPDFANLNVTSTNQSYMAVNYNYIQRPSERKVDPTTDDCTCTYPAGHPSTEVRLGKSYAMQIFMVVKNKKETDRSDGTADVQRVWNYSFSNLAYNFKLDRPAFSKQFTHDYTNNTVKAGYANASVTGPNYTTVGGPVTNYTHLTSNFFWGKISQIEAKTAGGVTISLQQKNYDKTTAFTPPTSVTDHPDFPNITGSTAVITFDMPYFYETRFISSINSDNSDYLKSYFVKLTSDVSTTYETGGSNTITTTYEYFEADNNLSTSSEGYKNLLGLSALPATLTFAPSWQLFRTKTYSGEYNTSGNELYTQQEHYYLYDLANSTAYQTSGAVNSNFKNLWYVWKKSMRNVPFENRTITKHSVSENPKRVSSNTIYQKFNEVSGDALTGQLLPTAAWIQIAAASTNNVMSFESASSFRAKANWAYLRTDSIVSYDQYNLAPKVVWNVLGLVTTNTYNQHTGLPTQQEVGTGLTDKMTTTYTYNTDNTLASAAYPNSLTYSYKYDKLKRPTLMQRNNVDLKRMEYNQFNDLNTTSTFDQRTANNFTRTATFLNSTDSTSLFVYFDPLGRTAGSIDDGAIRDNTFYDVFDRPIYTRRPFLGTAVATTHPTSTVFDYLQYSYDAAPRRRLLKSAPYGQSVVSSTRVVSNQYDIITSTTLTSLLTSAGSTATVPAGTKFVRERVTDHDGKISTVITNFFGQKVADITGSGLAATVYEYDAAGNIKKVVNPEGQTSTFTFNYLNWVNEKNSPDEGTIKYAFNRAGQVIADRNALNQMRFYAYDNYGRLITQRYLASGTTSVFDAGGMVWTSSTANTQYTGYLSSTSVITEKRWIYNGYDTGTSTLFATATTTLLNGGGQTNTLGRLAQVISYNLAGNPVHIQLLSYSTEGFLTWEIQQFNEAGITSTNKGMSNKLDYVTYNNAGSLIKENVDVSFDGVLDLQYFRTYDKRNRLKDVYVSYLDSGTSGKKVVTYTYDDATNLVTKKEFFDRNQDGTCQRAVDAVDYTYDGRYRLTRMDSKTLDYYMTYDANQPPVNVTGNLTSTNYNGNINGIYANYKMPVFLGGAVANFTGATSYTYQYDNLNRLTSADARVARTTTYSSLTANELLYGDNTFTYDRVGNIATTSIWLMNPANTTVEQYGYTYAYAAGKNALSTITKTAGSNTGLDRTLSTDASGRLTGDTKKSLNSFVYRPSNLVWEHGFSTTNSPKVKYLYDAADRRIYKEVSDNRPSISVKEHYLYDALGHEIVMIDRLGTNLNTYYVHGREREVRFPDGRKVGGGAGLVGDSSETLYKNRAIRTDAYELPYPNAFYLVTPTDTVAPLGYILSSELPENQNILRQMQAVPLNRPTDRFVVTDSSGNNPRLMDVQEILELRATGERFYLEGYSDACAATEMSAKALLPDPSIIDFRYYIYDHLGNTRVVYNTNITGCTTHTYTLEFAADYSPYGRLLRSFSIAGGRERYLTTGHERDSETGYDNRGARLYDAEIGRFMTVDPLAAKFAGWSTYNYVMGNPIKFVDPDGRSAKSTHIDENGKVLAVYNDGDLSVYQHSRESVSQWGQNGQAYLLNTGEGVRLVGETHKWNQFLDKVGENSFFGFEGVNEDNASFDNPKKYSRAEYSHLELAADMSTTFGTASGAVDFMDNGLINNLDEVADVARIAGKYLTGFSVGVDISLYAMDKQSLAKTIVNIGVGVGTALLLTNPATALGVGLLYLTLDKSGAVDAVLTGVGLQK